MQSLAYFDRERTNYDSYDQEEKEEDGGGGGGDGNNDNQYSDNYDDDDKKEKKRKEKTTTMNIIIFISATVIIIIGLPKGFLLFPSPPSSFLSPSILCNYLLMDTTISLEGAEQVTRSDCQR